MKKIRSGFKKIALILLLALLFQFGTSYSAKAYFNRGTVNVSLGQSSITLQQGESSSVSVNVSPGQDSQLPGCGMAECPQSCGAKNCLNDDFQCTCAGTTYQTYKTSVSASSSNTSVAVANYSNGVLKIKANSPGTTTINVNAQLRQFTAGNKSIKVVVNGAKSSNNSANSSNSANNASASKNQGVADNIAKETTTNNKSGIEVSDIAKTEEQEKNEQIAEEQQVAEDEAATIKTIETQQGTYQIIDLATIDSTKAYFEKAIADKSIITFQQKNGDNIVYSWTFKGADLKSSPDLDLNIKFGNKADSVLGKIIKRNNCFLMDFAHHGALPSEAEIYLNVAEKFADGKKLYLYYFDKDTKEIKLVQENLLVRDGYTKFKIDHCSQYFLSDTLIKDNNTIWPYITGGIALILIIAVGAILLIKNKKQKQNPNQGINK